ncbi:hypothetical protein ACLB2K_021203 [Fragaria x ananassa]
MDLTLEDDNLEFSLNQASIDKASDHNSQEKEVRKLKSPYVGMIFETLNEVGQYYEDYESKNMQETLTVSDKEDSDEEDSDEEDSDNNYEE